MMDSKATFEDEIPVPSDEELEALIAAHEQANHQAMIDSMNNPDFGHIGSWDAPEGEPRCVFCNVAVYHTDTECWNCYAGLGCNHD